MFDSVEIPSEMKEEFSKQISDISNFFKFTFTKKEKRYRVLKTIMLILFAVPFLVVKVPLAIVLLVFEAIGFTVCRFLAFTIILAPISLLIGYVFGAVTVILQLLLRLITYLFNLTETISCAVCNNEETIEKCANRFEEGIETIMSKMNCEFFAQYSCGKNIEPIIAAVLFISNDVVMSDREIRARFAQEFWKKIERRFSADQLATYDNAVDLFGSIVRGETRVRGDWCFLKEQPELFIAKIMIAGGDLLFSSELVDNYNGAPLQIKTPNAHMVFDDEYTELMDVIFAQVMSIFNENTLKG